MRKSPLMAGWSCPACGAVEKLNKKCRVCHDHYKRAWYAANREQSLEASRAWKAANREKNMEAARAWYAANREKSMEAARAYRAANPEKSREGVILSQRKRKNRIALIALAQMGDAILTQAMESL